MKYKHSIEKPLTDSKKPESVLFIQVDRHPNTMEQFIERVEQCLKENENRKIKIIFTDDSLTDS